MLLFCLQEISVDTYDELVNSTMVFVCGLARVDGRMLKNEPPHTLQSPRPHSRFLLTPVLDLLRPAASD
jgi:hypothetical protein